MYGLGIATSGRIYSLKERWHTVSISRAASCASFCESFYESFCASFYESFCARFRCAVLRPNWLSPIDFPRRRRKVLPKRIKKREKKEKRNKKREAKKETPGVKNGEIWRKKGH